MNVFDGHEDFFNLDPRTKRAGLPLVKELVIEKYKRILPESLVKDKIILDLGSCLGSVGHWVLSHGAKQYIGIESQSNFVNISNKLLSHWGDKKLINKIDIKEYFNMVNAKFDIVIAFGVFHGSMDYYDLLKLIFNQTDMLIIESFTPPSVLINKTLDFGLIEYGSKTAMSQMISDKGEVSYTGLTGIPSLMYFNLVAESCGFTSHVCDAKGLDINSKLIQNDSDDIPVRFFMKYKKSDNPKILTLEDSFKQNITVGSGKFFTTEFEE